MRRSHIWILVAAMLSPVSRAGPSAAQGGRDSDASPIYGVTIPDGYRQWEFVAVSREADPLNELRAILANAVALTAYRAGTTPFPDGTILAKLAWKQVPSSRFEGAFVAGAATTIQFIVKDSNRYPATGGWDSAALSTASRSTKPSTKRASIATRPS